MIVNTDVCIHHHSEECHDKGERKNPKMQLNMRWCSYEQANLKYERGAINLSHTSNKGNTEIAKISFKLKLLCKCLDILYISMCRSLLNSLKCTCFPNALIVSCPFISHKKLFLYKSQTNNILILRDNFGFAESP